MKTKQKVRIRFYHQAGVSLQFACSACGHLVAKHADACACGVKLGHHDHALELADLVGMFQRMPPRYRKFKKLLCRHFPDDCAPWTDEITKAMHAFEKAVGLYEGPRSARATKER